MKQNLLLFAAVLFLCSFTRNSSISITSFTKQVSVQSPYITVGNITGSKGTVADVLSNPRLVVNPQEKDPKDVIHLHSFLMTLVSKDGKKVFETTYGYRFTGDQIAAIKNLQRGDVILVEQINGKRLSEDLKYFPSVKLIIE